MTVNLLASATSTPPHAFSTTELIAALMHKLSPELINIIGALGVERRYSTMENFPAYIGGEQMYATSSATELGVRAARRCIDEWGGDPRRVGLLIAGTNTPEQLLPCLASEVMANMHGLLSRSISTVSMQAQGCSVLLKTVEVAGWYLAANPGKVALIVLSEAHTPYVTPVFSEECFGYRELARMRETGKLDEEEAARRQLDTTFMVQAMLFGDGAVALLVGSEEGHAAFGPVAHLTNDEPGDVDLLTMGLRSLRPRPSGRPSYLMRPGVPERGAHYALDTVRRVLEHPDSVVNSLEEVRGCLIHTGSKKILDGVCAQLSIAPDSARVRTSYEVLKTHGNLSSASTGFMLAARDKHPEGPALVVGFGVGFTASAGVVNFG